MTITRIPGYALLGFRRLWRRLRMYLLLPLLKEHGRNIWLDPDGIYSFENISLGSDVSLGQAPILMAAESSIIIGNKVMFGPGVTLLGGRHNTAQPGRFMFDVKEKRPDDDLGIVIEDDVWIGSKAVILRGVTIGRGAIVAAGSIVTKNVPAYAVMVGCPARILKFRWDLDTILQHERTLYILEDRISEEQLKSTMSARTSGFDMPSHSPRIR
jgi:acetyltransferase-like isoleucine patch superfamily enzyme